MVVALLVRLHVNIHPFRRSALQGQSQKLAVSVAAR